MAQIEGHFNWGRFLSDRIVALLTLAAMLLGNAWMFAANVPGRFLVTGLVVLIATVGLLNSLVWLLTIVTRFQLRDEKLTFSRLARRRRTIAAAEIAVVTQLEPRNENENVSAAEVDLRDGTTLHLAFDYLSNAEELSDELQASVHREPGVIEGRLASNAIANAVIQQLMSCALLTPVAIPGCVFIFIAVRKIPLIDVWHFLLLGCVLLILAALGFYVTVPRYWRGTVRWFRLEQQTLQYRTVLSRHVRQRMVSELQLVESHRPPSKQGEDGSWNFVQFRDGQRIKLCVGGLQNVQPLYDALRMHLASQSSPVRPITKTSIAADNLLYERIAPHLQEGETIAWAGVPVFDKVPSDLAATVVFGVVLSLAGLGMMGVMLWIFVTQRELGSLFGVLIGGLSLAAGLAFSDAPRQIRARLKKTVYAVTSHRAICLESSIWGSNSIPHRTTQAVRFFSPEEFRGYQLVRGGRDIALSGSWRRGRGGFQFWEYAGFLAPK